MKMIYFENEDILHLALADEPEAATIEVSPDVTAELNEREELIGIEILNATLFLRNIVEGGQSWQQMNYRNAY